MKKVYKEIIELLKTLGIKLKENTDRRATIYAYNVLYEEYRHYADIQLTFETNGIEDVLKIGFFGSHYYEKKSKEFDDKINEIITYFKSNELFRKRHENSILNNLKEKAKALNLDSDEILTPYNNPTSGVIKFGFRTRDQENFQALKVYESYAGSNKVILELIGPDDNHLNTWVYEEYQPNIEEILVDFELQHLEILKNQVQRKAM